jgi:hypothetical protein
MSDNLACRTGCTWRLAPDPRRNNTAESLPNDLVNVVAKCLSSMNLGNFSVNKHITEILAPTMAERLEVSEREQRQLVYDNTLFTPIAVATSSTHVFVLNENRVLIFGRSTMYLVRAVKIPFPQRVDAKLVVDEASQRFAVMCPGVSSVYIYTLAGTAVLTHRVYKKTKHRNNNVLAVALTPLTIVSLVYDFNYPGDIYSALQVRSIRQEGKLLSETSVDTIAFQYSNEAYEILISPDDTDTVYVLQHKFKPKNVHHVRSMVVAYSLKPSTCQRRRVVYVTHQLLRSISIVGNTITAMQRVDDGARHVTANDPRNTIGFPMIIFEDERWNLVSFPLHNNMEWTAEMDEMKEQAPWSIPTVHCLVNKTSMAISANCHGELQTFRCERGMAPTPEEAVELRNAGIATNWAFPSDESPVPFQQVICQNTSGSIVKSYGRTNIWRRNVRNWANRKR